jgi:branched-chain amino acid transport system substrate-binding protein
MVFIDDQTDPKLVLDIYKRLLDEEKVDLVIGGYGDNSVAPAMPLSSRSRAPKRLSGRRT